MRIAFVTSAQVGGITGDDELTASLLRARGHQVIPAIWDDGGVSWRAFDGVIIRSPWDYHFRPAAFAEWLRRRQRDGSRVLNPPAAVLENIDKRYLLELAARGVAIVPTVHLQRGSNAALPAILSERGWNEVVVKPAISAGAYRTWRSRASAAVADERRFADDLSSHDVLVQQYLPEVETEGEWSVIFFDGAYSHSVLKRPARGDFRVQAEAGGTAHAAQPNKRWIGDAATVLVHASGSLLYARVDGVIREGRFRLMELEINEPSLFLATSAAAPATFAAAIERALVDSTTADRTGD